VIPKEVGGYPGSGYIRGLGAAVGQELSMCLIGAYMCHRGRMTHISANRAHPQPGAELYLHQIMPSVFLLCLSPLVGPPAVSAGSVSSGRRRDKSSSTLKVYVLDISTIVFTFLGCSMFFDDWKIVGMAGGPRSRLLGVDSGPRKRGGPGGPRTL
jgi:hypothetical protein